jgi:hypothetical protein
LDEFFKSGVVGSVVLYVHLPVEYVVEEFVFEETDFCTVVFEFIAESFVVVLVYAAELFVEVADVPCAHYEDECFFEFVLISGQVPKTMETFLLLSFIAVVFV